MARFTIYSPTGVALYEGTPTFTGQYMKPGLLEFREVALPNLVELVPGCYVDYTRVTDTVNGVEVPRRFKVYTVSQLKKQARSNSYGGAFVYQNVQLYDASKELEYCPFRDLVAGDNRIHFSTQPSISTFEGCDGLAARFEACLRDQYDVGGVQSWRVRTATSTDGASQDLLDLMDDARDFTVSGVNILECLDKVYEIWPEVGWIYTVERINGVPTNTIIIGGAGLNANQGTYAYGKGKGLKSLTRTAANVDEMANRIYAYGSSRNMLPKWYNRQNIKDAQSVDIQNLMIPIARWGTTPVSGSNLPDASKAYVENTDSIDRIGLRPKTAYFDGSGEYPEIYPSIREKTIGDLWRVMSSSAQFYPSHAIYSSGDRIDTVLSAQETYDSGLAGNTPGKANVEMGDTPFYSSGSFEMLAGLTYYPFYHYQGTWTPETAGIQTVAWKLDISGQVQLDGIEKVVVSVDVKDPSYQGPIILANEYELTPDESGIVTLSGMDMYAEKVNVSAVDYYVHVDVSVYMTAQETDKTGTYTANGNVGFALQNYRKKTFTISLRQIGFDINAQSALSDGKSISMRSGKCQGRTFTIKNVQYDSYNDAWNLECFRSEDESLSQWFPNTDYPVRGKEQDYDGDEFVLLDIAMPELYVILAENELYQAALDLLSDTAVERWQYVPEIDAKYMVENSRTIRSGEYMAIIDPNIILDGVDNFVYFRTSGGDYYLTSNGERIIVDGGILTTVLVDTIVINEGEAAIPTYKVTLRDRKRKTWTESNGADVPSSKSVGSITETQVSQSSSSSESKYFTLDENGNVTLKPQYSNLWVPGWMAAGGVGSQSGGGGGSSYMNDLLDVTAPNPATDDLLRWNGSAWVNVPQSSIVPTISVVVPSSGNALTGVTASSGTLTFTKGTFVTSVTVDQTVSSGTEIGSISVNNGSAVKLYAPSLTRRAITDLIADRTTILGLYADRATSDADGNSFASTYATIDSLNELNIITGITTQQDCTVDFSWRNGNITKVDLNHDHTYYVAGTLAQHISSKTALLGVTGISNNSAWGVSGDNSQVVWTGSAWHFKGNIYADGWIAAGGIGDDQGTSGSLYALPEVGVTSPTNGQFFYYNGTRWVNTNVKTINGNSIIGSGDITIQGGGGTVTSIMMNGSTISPSDGVVDLGTVITSLTGYATESWVGQQGYLTSYTETDPTVPSWAKASSKPSYAFSELTSHPTTLSGYGITDAHITNEIVTLGANTIKPVTIDTTQTITGGKTFTTAPVSIGSDSGLSVDGASYIDIGNARLVYDSGANALHITRRTGGSSNLVGLFADGFVAAGGVGSQSTFSYVTLDSNQTIDGDKSFDGTITFNGLLNVDCPSIFSTEAQFTDGISLSGGDLDIDDVVISTGTIDGAKGLTVGKNAKFTWTEGGVTKTVTIKNLLDRIVALENA